MTEETDETDETCLSTTGLPGTSAYSTCSIAYMNVGAMTRGVFKAYVGFLHLDFALLLFPKETIFG